MKYVIQFILVLGLTGNVLAQNQFQQFISYVNSLTDPADKQAAVDSFMTYARGEGIPFIENDSANFIYQGTVSLVSAAGDFNGWDPNTEQMSNLSQTNFWYLSKIFEPDARLDYKFVLNGTNWILDPENPNTVSGGFGPNSELAMPEYVQPWEIEYNTNIEHGTVENRYIFSNHLNATHQLKIYLPPDYDTLSSTLYPSVYFQDGFEYVSLGSAVNVIDNLIDSNKIESVIAVFIKPNNRNEEYAFSKRIQYQNFFVSELVPFIDSLYKTYQSPDKRLVLGDSFGGNISALISFNYPETFGNCGLHSAAFWPNNFETYNLIVNAEKKDIKWSSVWGTYESLYSNMRDFRDIMIGKGYEFDWEEKHEGHSWGLWRATTDNILEYIFPANSTSVEDETATQSEFELYQSYPNPFNPVTKIKYTLSRSTDYQSVQFAELKVYDVLGNEVATLVKEHKPEGTYEVIFNPKNLPAGVYFYKLQAGNYIETKKMILLK